MQKFSFLFNICLLGFTLSFMACSKKDENKLEENDTEVSENGKDNETSENNTNEVAEPLAKASEDDAKLVEGCPKKTVMIELNYDDDDKGENNFKHEMVEVKKAKAEWIAYNPFESDEVKEERLEITLASVENQPKNKGDFVFRFSISNQKKKLELGKYTSPACEVGEDDRPLYLWMISLENWENGQEGQARYCSEGFVEITKITDTEVCGTFDLKGGLSAEAKTSIKGVFSVPISK